MKLEWGKLVVQLMTAVFWPAAVFGIACLFKPQIRELLGRIRKIDAAGFHIEADAEQLTQKTAEIKEVQYPGEPVKQPPTGESAQQVARTKVTATLIEGPTNFEEMLIRAASTPRSAALLVRHTVESEMRRLLAATGRFSRAGQQMQKIPFVQMMDEAEQTRLLSPELISSIRQFRELANQVIHGETDEQRTGTEITAAGLNIIRALRSIPHQRNFVEEPNVPIFSDPQCLSPAEGHGISLKAVVPPENLEVHYIYPTTKNHFQKGKEVAWEWNSTRRWGPTWYRDLPGGEIKEAWGASLEFVGRHLDDTWKTFDGRWPILVPANN
jgi:hypothetical protein